MVTITVEENQIRIDKYLITKLNYSRSKIQKMISDQQILVNDKAVKNNYTLKLNDLITIEDQEETELIAAPENIPLDILYEDEDLLVVNKPSSMVVHPACGNTHGTLVNALVHHCNHLSTVNGQVRPGIVHRIDADTSGLLVVAKTDEAHANLAKQIQNKTATRKYLALVQGIIKEDRGTIDAPIGRDKNNRKKMTVTAENSKQAVTNFRVLERYQDATLVECTLETGRTHQIRVHFAYIDHPLVNDPIYGYKKLIDPSFGQMLHATTIGFIHPTSQKPMEFNQEPPKRFYEILEEYRSRKWGILCQEN